MLLTIYPQADMRAANLSIVIPVLNERETLGATPSMLQLFRAACTALLMWCLRLACFFGAGPARLARRYHGG